MVRLIVTNQLLAEEKLKNSSPEGLDRPTLRIGLFGLRGAGKTVALSTLYLIESSEDLEVTFRDEDTIRYLRPLAQSLERGDLPSPTMIASPTCLKWSARVGGATYNVEAIDFAGELLDILAQDRDAVTEQMMKELRTEVRDWFISCDAVVLFIDCTDHGTPTYRDALVRLLDEMSQRPTIRGSHERVVVVVFTKGDMLTDTPARLLSAVECQCLLEGHPLYQIVQHRLEQHGEQVRFRIFASSALGWRFMSVNKPAQRQVKPYNMFAPLRWGLEQAAKIVQDTHSQVLDELAQELDDRRSGCLIWALTNNRDLSRILEATNRDFQLMKGPYAHKVAELRQTIQAAWSNQFRAILLGTFAIVIIILVGYWSHFRAKRAAVFDEYEGLVRTSKLNLEDAVSYYELNIASQRVDWFWSLGNRRSAAGAQYDEDSRTLRRMLAEEAFSLWQSEDKNHHDARRNPHRYLAAKAYLDSHGDVAPEHIGKEVRQVLQDTEQAYNKELNTWRELSFGTSGTIQECQHKIKRLEQYLERPEALYGEEAKRLIQGTTLYWFAIVASLPCGTIQECQHKIKQLEQYLERPEVLYGEEAKGQLQTTSNQWYDLIAALPTGNRQECDCKRNQLEEYAREKTAICRNQAKKWMRVFDKGTKYLNDEFGPRKEGEEYWELSTGFSLNLNPMFAFVGDKWKVRWRKSDPWYLPSERIPPSGSGAAKTQEILNKLANYNSDSDSPIP